MSDRTLTAGVARVNITPPVGARFLGYILRVEPSVGIASELSATALVLANEATKVVLLDTDLCTFTVARADELRGAVAAALGIPLSHVLLAYSHTHNGPYVERGRYNVYSPAEELYIQSLAGYLVGVAQAADRNRKPARVAAGSGAAAVGINRLETLTDGKIILGQNPQGPVDHEVAVVRIDGLDGAPLAALVNYAAHPVVLGPEPLLISADYPGVVREVVERATGATCLFLMGAAGDQMPVEAWTTDNAPVQKMGGILGHEAVKVYLGIETRRTRVRTRVEKSLAEVLVYEIEADSGSTHTRLGAAERRIALPFMPPPSEAEAQRLYEQTMAECQQLRATESERMQYIVEIETRWLERLMAAVRGGKPPSAPVGAVQALRVDDVAILSAPGECFARIGLDAKARSPLPHTLFASYANGSAGYIRAADAYPRPGQRSVTPDAIAHKWAYCTPFAPECAALVVNSGLELLAGLR